MFQPQIYVVQITAGRVKLIFSQPFPIIAEYYGFPDKQVVKELLKRERRKERKLEAGIIPRPKGRPRKDTAPRDIVAEQAYEIRRLRMENQLLRDFLHCTGRK